MFIKKVFVFLWISILSFGLLGQNVEEILSLERGLKVRMSDRARLNNLYILANAYSDIDSSKYFYYLNEGYKLSKKSNDLVGFGSYYSTASIRSMLHQKYTNAVKESEKSAYYFLKAKDTVSYLNAIYINLYCRYESKHLSQIETVAFTTLKFINDQGFDVERGKIYGVLALYYRNLDLNLSKETFKKSITCALRAKDYKWLIMPYNNLSRIYSITGKNDSALVAAKLAVKYCELSGRSLDLEYLIAQNRLSYLLETKTSPEQAVKDLENISKTAIILKSKLIQDKGVITQILLLKIKESQQKFNNTLLIIAICFVVILLVIFFFIYRQSKKRQLELTFINQELEFSSYQNQLLLKETNHRVKNNFQMILGLLNLHANSAESNNKNFVQLSISRITAMAKVHEILHRKEVGRMEVLPYFHEILKLTMDSCFDKNYSLKITVLPKDLTLNIHTILPLGLIVNEMAINSIKHAFKDLNEGKIQINLQKLEEEYLLTFSDNGLGIDLKSIGDLSSGIKMIKSLALQLKGSVEISNENGTKFVLRFKQIGN